MPASVNQDASPLVVNVRHLAGVGERDIAEALFLTPRSVRAALDAMRGWDFRLRRNLTRPPKVHPSTSICTEGAHA